jgi:Fungal protein kinase
MISSTLLSFPAGSRSVLFDSHNDLGGILIRIGKVSIVESRYSRWPHLRYLRHLLRQKALQLTETVVKTRKRTLGEEHPDQAKELGSGPTGARHRTGTMEFMAIEILKGTAYIYRHGLESVFYVLLGVIIRHGQRLDKHLLKTSQLRN